MKILKDIWKRITCKHKYPLLETVHGDRIIYLNYTRSIWKCGKCGKIHFSEYLDKVK
jgi:RNase P subunit RPR2